MSMLLALQGAAPPAVGTPLRLLLGVGMSLLLGMILLGV